jgi:beta-lactamase class D
MLRLAVVGSLALVACSSSVPPPARTPITSHAQRNDLRVHFDSLHVTGSFILHDLSKDRWTYVDSAEATVSTLPASTYKILGTLIALETGVATDAQTVLPWDSIKRRPEVDQDLSLYEAYHRSAYWFHRDVARRIGANELKRIWDAVGYGNADTSGGYDRAWVKGNLRISPVEQITFLERLYRNELSFSQRSMDITKAIMVQEDSVGYVLRAKTGWAVLDSLDLGWYVGWVQRQDSAGPYFFATRIRCSDPKNQAFGPARISTTRAFLSDLGVLPH